MINQTLSNLYMLIMLVIFVLYFLFFFCVCVEIGVTSILKRIDVIFDDMEWMLTQKDGQLGIATVYVKKFRSVLFTLFIPYKKTFT